MEKITHNFPSYIKPNLTYNYISQLIWVFFLSVCLPNIPCNFSQILPKVTVAEKLYCN